MSSVPNVWLLHPSTSQIWEHSVLRRIVVPPDLDSAMDGAALNSPGIQSTTQNMNSTKPLRGGFCYSYYPKLWLLQSSGYPFYATQALLQT